MITLARALKQLMHWLEPSPARRLECELARSSNLEYADRRIHDIEAARRSPLAYEND